MNNQARRGKAWHGLAGHGTDWQAWHGTAGHGLARRGTAGEVISSQRVGYENIGRIYIGGTGSGPARR